MDCMVTQGYEGWAGCAAGSTIRPSMPAIQPYDTAIRGPRYGQPPLKGLAAMSWVAIQNCIVAERRATVMSRYNAAKGCDTALNALLHGAGALRHTQQRAHGLGARCVVI